MMVRKKSVFFLNPINQSTSMSLIQFQQGGGCALTFVHRQLGGSLVSLDQLRYSVHWIKKGSNAKRLKSSNSNFNFNILQSN